MNRAWRFGQDRQSVRRGGEWLPVTDILPPKEKEEVKELTVRVRTIGDIISTGLVESPANTVDDIIEHIDGRLSKINGMSPVRREFLSETMNLSRELLKEVPGATISNALVIPKQAVSASRGIFVCESHPNVPTCYALPSFLSAATNLLRYFAASSDLSWASSCATVARWVSAVCLVTELVATSPS